MNRKHYQSDIERLGKNIAYYRKRQRLSQEALAEKCGLSTEHIHFIERGYRAPSIVSLLKISNALGVPLYILTNYRLVSDGSCRNNGLYCNIIELIDKKIEDKNFLERLFQLILLIIDDSGKGTTYSTKKGP